MATNERYNEDSTIHAEAKSIELFLGRELTDMERAFVRSCLRVAYNAGRVYATDKALGILKEKQQ